MGKTHLSGLSISGTGDGSGTSLGAVDAGALTGSTLSLSGALTGALVTSSGLSMVGSGQISLRTVANASSLGTTELGVVFQASGVSLIYRSDDTAYTVGASAVSAAL